MHEEWVRHVKCICLSSLHVNGIIHGLLMNTASGQTTVCACKHSKCDLPEEFSEAITTENGTQVEYKLRKD